jgi:hypothetical protein
MESVQAIQYLSIPVTVGSAPFSPARSRAWASTLWGYNLTRRFANLKELRITLELYFPRDVMGTRKPTYLDCKEEVGLSGEEFADQYTNWLEQFSKLRPLRTSKARSLHFAAPSSSQFQKEPPPSHGEPLFSISPLQSNPVRFKVMVCDDPLSMWGPVGQVQYCRDNRIRNVSVWMSEREEKCLTVEQKQKLAEEMEVRLRITSARIPQATDNESS